MPRKTLKPKPDGDRWMVDVPAKSSPSGKRERHWFKLRADARDFAARLSEDPEAMTAHEATDAARALVLLDGTGATLVDAAREFRERWDRAHVSARLGYAAHLWAECADVEEVTRKGYFRTAGFLSPLSDRMLSEIEPRELAELLSTWSRGTYRQNYGNARSFWNWASRAPRHWCKAEAFDSVEKPKRLKIKRAVVLTPEQVAKQLAVAEEVDFAMARAYAILLHSGLRKGEAERMSGEDFTEDGIRVSHDQAKLDAARFIPISDALRAWLDVYPITNGESVLPPNFENYNNQIRALCGWNVSSKFLDGNPNPDAPRFPRNGWRKTNASVMVASGHPVQDLAFIFGHAEGIDTLRRRYVGAMTKAEAEEILAIRPGKGGNHGK